MRKRAAIEPKKLATCLMRGAAVIAVLSTISGCAALPAIEAAAGIISALPSVASLPDKISSFFGGSSADQTADTGKPRLVTEADFLKGGDTVSARGDFATAAWFYAKAADANPNSLNARLRLANAQYALKDTGSAYANYRAALILSPDDPEAAMRAGEIELTQGDGQAALAHFATALRGKKNDPKLYNLMGVAFTMQGKYEMARQSFDVGLKLKPDYASLLNNYGMMQLQEGDFDAARATFTKLINSPYASDRYRTNRALVELAMGDTAAALADAPGMDEANLRVTLARYLRKGDPFQVADANNIRSDVAAHLTHAVPPADKDLPSIEPAAGQSSLQLLRQSPYDGVQATPSPY